VKRGRKWDVARFHTFTLMTVTSGSLLALSNLDLVRNNRRRV
jgi:hypothetical protein